jgi:O-methyltransferase involved in polyketide biosynthesis
MSETKQIHELEADHRKVAPTAYGVAYLRTFSDIPYAKEIFAALNDTMKASGQTYIPGSASKDRLAPQLEARYKLVDSLIAASGITQILEVAAGIAPRGLVYTESDPEIVFVEMDLDGVTEEMREILSAMSKNIPPNLTITAGDALNIEDMVAAASGFSTEQPIAVVNEGLMRYLTFDQKATYAKNVRALLTKFGGVWITPDISLRQALVQEDNAAIGHTKSLKDTTGIDVNNNVFEDEPEAIKFFEDLGFKVESHSFLEVGDILTSQARLGMSDVDVRALNEPCLAFVMTI